MTIISRVALSTRAFLVDYCQRHRHPINAGLHIIGVPMAFYGLFKFTTGKLGLGFVLLVGGYLFQYLGHKAQGNEVGEVTLIKAIWRRLSAKSIAKTE